MNRILIKRLTVSGLLAGLYYVWMHMQTHESDQFINLGTIGVFLFCVLYSLTMDKEIK